MRDAARVQRTFAFVDLCGFTAYTEARGDDAALAVLAHLRATLRATAERSGVRISKWLGDGAMICGTEPHRTLECAETVRDRVALHGPLALRGGVAGGPVVVLEGDDYVGAAVTISARLCDKARPGELLVAETLLERLGDDRTAEPMTMRLNGLSRPVTARRLLAHTCPAAA